MPSQLTSDVRLIDCVRAAVNQPQHDRIGIRSDPSRLGGQALGTADLRIIKRLAQQPSVVLPLLGLTGFLIDLLVKPISTPGLILLLIASLPWLRPCLSRSRGATGGMGEVRAEKGVLTEVTQDDRAGNIPNAGKLRQQRSTSAALALPAEKDRSPSRTARILDAIEAELRGGHRAMD